ncbi:MAG: hypothetical protein ACTSYE_05365 [Alphaproteobacteria bacterium]
MRGIDLVNRLFLALGEEATHQAPVRYIRPGGCGRRQALTIEFGPATDARAGLPASDNLSLSWLRQGRRRGCAFDCRMT